MRFRTSPSVAVDQMKDRSSDSLRCEYELIARERNGGHNVLGAIADQNDIARELERRGDL